MPPWKNLLLRLALGLVFLAAGLSKTGDPLRLLASVYSYQIAIPDELALLVAHSLPWLEILLGLALIAGFFIRWTALLATGLLLCFLTLSAQVWWRELPIDCGCLDLAFLHPSLAILSSPLGALLRNFVLLVLSITLLIPARATLSKTL
jgi:uncharacterized membrane protein YphA (DoxX/SURF4 family)